MRKYFLIFVLIIFIVLFFWIMILGLKIGNLKIYSYREVENIDTQKRQLLSELYYKNTTEYSGKKAALASAVQEYKNKKGQYDELVEKGKIESDDSPISIYSYDMDFLYATIGNYATQQGVTLQLDVYVNSTQNSVSSEYVMCDLNFSITGGYSSITNFIYRIEDDEKLNFEISNFIMEKGGEDVQATFVVKKVPINSKNLSTSTYSVVSGSDTTSKPSEN